MRASFKPHDNFAVLWMKILRFRKAKSNLPKVTKTASDRPGIWASFLIKRLSYCHFWSVKLSLRGSFTVWAPQSKGNEVVASFFSVCQSYSAHCFTTSSDLCRIKNLLNKVGPISLLRCSWRNQVTQELVNMSGRSTIVRGSQGKREFFFSLGKQKTAQTGLPCLQGI